jgi:hypothetical protein
MAEKFQNPGIGGWLGIFFRLQHDGKLSRNRPARISLFRHPPGASFIDTPFQRGGWEREFGGNRFQRFRARETAEAVETTRLLGSAPLKRGVNQSMAAKGFHRAQKVRCGAPGGSMRF